MILAAFWEASQSFFTAPFIRQGHQRPQKTTTWSGAHGDSYAQAHVQAHGHGYAHALVPQPISLTQTILRYEKNA